MQSILPKLGRMFNVTLPAAAAGPAADGCTGDLIALTDFTRDLPSKNHQCRLM